MTKPSLKIALRQFPSLDQLMERLQTQTFRPAGRHRVYMSFVRNRGRWHCRFHQDDLPKTPISRQFVFSSTEKVYEAALRGNGLIDMESRHDLDEAINIGRGGIWLALSEDHYSALVKTKSSNR